MKKSFILLASVFLMIFLGIFIGISLFRSSLQMSLIRTRRDSLYAFYAAEAGLQRSLFELRRSIDWNAGFANEPLIWTQGSPQITLGYYDVSVGTRYFDGSWEIVPLQATGRNAEGNITRVINAEAITQSPAFFFVSTLGDLKVGGGASIGSSILARDIGFEPGDSQITVNGNVTYLRNLSGYDPGNPGATPNISITGDVSQGEPITFVGVDLPRYKELAQSGGKYIDGDFTISGDISRSGLQAPNGLVYAEGNVNIQGDVSDSLLIVAGGDINIEGDIEYAQPGAQIGLFAGNDIVIAEDAPDALTVDGLLIADGGVFRAEGGKGSKSQLNFNGAISVRGKEGERTVIDLNVYRDRVYYYDQALYNNPQIPFMAFIADLRHWQEE